MTMHTISQKGMISHMGITCVERNEPLQRKNIKT